MGTTVTILIILVIILNAFVGYKVFISYSTLIEEEDKEETAPWDGYLGRVPKPEEWGKDK